MDNANSTLDPGIRSEGEDLTDGSTEFVLKNGSGAVCVRIHGELELQYQYQLSDGNLVSTTSSGTNRPLTAVQVCVGAIWRRHMSG